MSSRQSLKFVEHLRQTGRLDGVDDGALLHIVLALPGGDHGPALEQAGR